MKNLIQIIKFGLVGLSNTVISLLIYYVLIWGGINYLLSTITGYLLSSVWGYFLNKIWVFKAKKQRAFGKSLTRYYIVYSVSLILSIALAYFWVDLLGITKYISPILSMCITIPFNFVLNKYWVYQ